MPASPKKTLPETLTVPDSANPASYVGKVLPFGEGKIVLMEELGTGGSARVSKGRHQQASGKREIVAVKSLLNKFLEEVELRTLFEYEAQISIQLAHPNIIKTHGLVRLENELHLIIEFIAGKNVAQIKEDLSKAKQCLSFDAALVIVYEVATALSYAHTKCDDKTGVPLNLIHRDVTPRNIMISFKGEVKLLDFGIAKIKNRIALTDVNFFRGTKRYASPEHRSGKPLDCRSDIYSCGVILNELLGLISEGASTDNSAITSHPSPRELSIQEAREICGKCMAPNPDDRYLTALELRRDLEGLLQVLGGVARAHKKLESLMSELYTGAEVINDEEERIEALLSEAPSYRTFTKKRRGDWLRSRVVRWAVRGLAYLLLLSTLCFGGTWIFNMVRARQLSVHVAHLTGDPALYPRWERNFQYAYQKLKKFFGMMKAESNKLDSGMAPVKPRPKPKR